MLSFCYIFDILTLSVVIKVGGEKVSALEVERDILEMYVSLCPLMLWSLC